MAKPIEAIEAGGEDVCRACGACCAHSAEWPRFALESEAALAALAPIYVDEARGAMRCEGNRCAALEGQVGVATSCKVYPARPDVCRECLPGDGACAVARRGAGLSPLALSAEPILQA